MNPDNDSEYERPAHPYDRHPELRPVCDNTLNARGVPIAYIAGSPVRRLRTWLSAWATTLHIKFFERDTYRAVTGPFDPDDFMEVGPPDDDPVAYAREHADSPGMHALLDEVERGRARREAQEKDSS